MRFVIAAFLWSAFSSMAFVGTASAHALWIEPEGETYQLYFGEFGDAVEVRNTHGLLARYFAHSSTPRCMPTAHTPQMANTTTAYQRGSIEKIDIG